MSDDYEVGYGKPPKNTRFKKGQSGNPKGRPKKSHSFSMLMDKELNQKITIKEGNKTITMTKREAVVKKLVYKALKGDNRAYMSILYLDRETDPETEALSELTSEEENIFLENLKRIKQRNDNQSRSV